MFLNMWVYVVVCVWFVVWFGLVCDRDKGCVGVNGDKHDVDNVDSLVFILL